MLVSWQMLTKHFRSPRFVTVPKLVDVLNQIGVEVEEVIDYQDLNSKLVVGEVMSCEKHPGADRLKCCSVNVGLKKELKIICGADNVRAGIKVVVAQIGAHLANEMSIVAREIRKVPSEGMLCSYNEIGIPAEVLSDRFSNGIIELPGEAIPGDSNVLRHLQYNDIVLSLKFASNRSDLSSLQGLSRDIAAFLHGNIVPLETSHDCDFHNKITPHIAENCAKSLATLSFQNFDHSVTTPNWMQFSLWKSGFKTIHPAVDIANYVMLETGQPLHAYDSQSVQTSLTAAKCKKDFLFTGLDNQQYSLKTDDIVIINEKKKIVGLAGVLGSKWSSVVRDTTAVTVEAGSFDQFKIAKTSKRLNLITSAAQCFSKGVDHVLAKHALERYAFLLKKIYKKVDVSNINLVLKSLQKREIALPNSLVNKILGTNFVLKDVTKTLERLGLICVPDTKVIRVSVPSFRPDLTSPVDLVEEVLRMHNIDDLPAIPPVQSVKCFNANPTNSLLTKTRDFMQSCRFHEVKTYSLTSVKANKIYNLFGYHELAKLVNPLGYHREVMRLSLLPSMLEITSGNERHLRVFEKEWRFRLGQLNFFEISDLNHASGANVHLGIILNEPLIASTQDWFSNTEDELLNELKPSFYVLKGIVQSWLKETISASQYKTISFVQEPIGNNLLHPFNTLLLKIKNKIIGYFGELHPELLAKFNLQNARFAGEFNLSALQFRTPLTELVDPNYQEIQRDFSVLIKEENPPSSLKKDLKDCHQAITVVYYCGSFPLEKGFSATYRIFSQAPLKNAKLIAEVREAVLAVFKKHKLALKY